MHRASAQRSQHRRFVQRQHQKRADKPMLLSVCRCIITLQYRSPVIMATFAKLTTLLQTRVEKKKRSTDAE